MKKECHNKDIISPSHLIDLMRGPFITPIKPTSDDFKYWDKMLDANYRRLASNTTSINHVFTYDVVTPGVLVTQRVQYSPFTKQWLLKGRKKQINWTEFDHECRRMLIEASKPETIQKIGIKPINKVEMYTKWLPLIVGKPSADTLCPLPSDDIMKGVKEDKNMKAGQKRAAKRKVNKLTAKEGSITYSQPLTIQEAAGHNNALVALSVAESGGCGKSRILRK